ncbi:MAG: hypothetical protein K8S00_03840 [Bacteroidales bacterium]|nr:hypothetical protein [Bacteroidales bacterium]
MKEQIRLYERILRSAFSQLTKPQLKVLAELIIALSRTASFTLRDIASNFQGDSDVKHKLKKLQYFLDGLDLNYYFWKSYISLILCLPNLKLSKRDKISITISSGNLGPSFRLITASISYRNQPLPLFLKLWNDYGYPANFKTEVKSILLLLKVQLSAKYNYVFIIDENLEEKNLTEICASQETDYIIRIRPNRLKLKDASDFTDIKLFPDGIYQDSNTDVFPADLNSNVAIISIPSEDDSRSRLYFATNLTNKENIFNYYSNRMFFEDDLSFLINELKWSKYSKKLPERSRFEKLLIASCISYALNSSNENDIVKKLQHIIVNLLRNTN